MLEKPVLAWAVHGSEPMLAAVPAGGGYVKWTLCVW